MKNWVANLWAVNSKEKGFSLIEVMIVIVILGLMAAFAAPEFRTRTVKAQIGGAVTELQASLAMARSEALRNGQYATLQSDASDDFSQGWEVVVPPIPGSSSSSSGSSSGGSGGGSTSATPFTAATFTPPKGLSVFKLVGSSGTNHKIKFFGDGRADIAEDTHFCIKAQATSGELHRKVLLTRAGQALVLNEDCS